MRLARLARPVSLVTAVALAASTFLACSSRAPQGIATAPGDAAPYRGAPSRLEPYAATREAATDDAAAIAPSPVATPSVAANAQGVASPAAPPAQAPKDAKIKVAVTEAEKKSERMVKDEALVIATPPPAPETRIHPMVDAAKDRLSTFAIDVDTASYAFARRAIVEGGLPAATAVRVEEFVNAFDYGYEPPTGSSPLRVDLASAPSPFHAGRHLVRVALQAKRVEARDRTPVHLVYLVDTSGSMQGPDRLPLAQESLRLLTETLKPGDTVALCTYAGSVREVLPPTGIEHKSRIFSAIDDLTAGGSTAMSSGIDLAYELAARTRVAGHVNRVVVLSDGDANVGRTSHEEILRTIEQHKRNGITLSTIGFGTGNYRDQMMEQLADKGDGNYAYIDGRTEAKRVFQEHVSGLLQVVARDVKVQVEFDPARVASYRLLGYENRDVADRDFRNDKVDGGEVGAGHSVTALYEVVYKAGQEGGVVARVRHKPAIEGDRAKEELFELAPGARFASFDQAPASLRFAAAVARFADVLRGAPGASASELRNVASIARGSARGDAQHQELVRLVGLADERLGGSRVVAR
jgi:Ca-activated chloride channel family protein